MKSVRAACDVIFDDLLFTRILSTCLEHIALMQNYDPKAKFSVTILFRFLFLTRNCLLITHTTGYVLLELTKENRVVI